jgi:hypothetical protein
MRAGTKILVCLYMAVAVLPLAVMALHLRDHEIFGALPPANKPALSLDRFRSEDYQKEFTAWFESRLGWKGNAIKTDNALLYHVFRDTKPGSAVAIGRRGVLFKDEDIAYYNKDGAQLPSHARLDEMARRIAALQALLRKYGRALVPVLVPSKTSLYRDEIKPEWTRAHGQPRPTDRSVYRAMIAALDAHQVSYVDARALLTAPGIPREAVWGRFARHWSTYGACLTMQQVVRAYTSLTGKAVAYECKLAHARRPPSHDDFDLWNLLNMWKPPRINRVVAVVEHDPPLDGAVKPSVMCVGTSFCWNIMRDAAASLRFSAIHMDFYHNTLVAWPENTSVPVQRGSKDLGDAFLGKDLYVLDLFETYLQPANTYIDEFLDQVGTELERTAGIVVPVVKPTAAATITGIADLGVFEQQHYFELWGTFPNPNARYTATITCDGVRRDAVVYYQNPTGGQINVHLQIDPGTCDRTQQPPRISGVSCTFHVQQGDSPNSPVFGPRLVCPGPRGASGQEPDGRCMPGLSGC